MPLQTGTWKINSSGNIGTLTIQSIDTAGNVKGTLDSLPVEGFWDELSSRLFFVAGNIGLAIPIYVYTGFLAADRFRMPGVTADVVSTLAGYYTQMVGAPATTDRHVFGWYAQLGQD